MNAERLKARTVTLLVMLLLPGIARAEIAIPVIEDINNGGVGFGGAVNIFASGSGAPFQVDENATDGGNDIVVYTMNGLSANDGAGFAVSISNGENGITSTESGANMDVDNTVPADSVFTTIGNASGKLENGNVIRASVWMRQDPNSPVSVQPQVEPVLKVELWKEALSGAADFNAVPFPGGGDRIWDTDQNASNALFNGFNQSQASWVDVDNNGSIGNGQPVAESLVTDEWRLVETTLLIDDDPLDDGFGWSIGADFFTVADVEEIRSVMFVGDFAGTDLTNAGSFWVDNLLVEVFANEEAMLASPNPNPMPSDAAGLTGDYNIDGTVNAADYTVWRDGLGDEFVAADYDVWKNNFGAMAGAGASFSTSIPEPSTLWLMLLIGLFIARLRNN